MFKLSKILKKTKEDKKNNAFLEENKNQWIENDYEEGQLSIDVYETDKNIVIKSTIAGVKPEDIDISLDNDMLTIRGQRKEEKEDEGKNYLYKECYWGSFSRSVILPTDVDNKKIEAILENGILSIVLKKVQKSKKIGVKVK